jgi:nucleotide-binding universal stress UspA family protein
MSKTIIAYLGHGDHFAPLIERANSLALSRGAKLIFYDSDAASRLGASPLPTAWSGEGLKEQFSECLDPEQLEKAGQEELRDRVEAARRQGIDAFGWLPSKRGAKELAEYAVNRGADYLIVPSDLEQNGLADWLKGQPSADEVADESHLPVLVVQLGEKVS